MNVENAELAQRGGKPGERDGNERLHDIRQKFEQIAPSSDRKTDHQPDKKPGKEQQNEPGNEQLPPGVVDCFLPQGRIHVEPIAPV